MESKVLRLQWYCFSLLLLVVVSCSLNRELKQPEGERFREEISRLEKLAREAPATSVRAKSHLQLAFLYVNCRNPQLSYSRALQEMESYLSMSPDEAPKDEFQNWLVVLREMDRLSKDRIEVEKKNQSLRIQGDKLQAGLEKLHKANTYFRDEVATLKEINIKLQAALEKVEKANNKMIETIEKLKTLDFQMEEKRSLIK